jgi:hypothetical protein
MINIDLINENAIEIGANYLATFQLCNSPDLTLYTGVCQIRQTNTATDIILTPTVQILNKDTFSIKIQYTVYPVTLAAGNYVYDALFSKTDGTDRFYAVGGKIQIVKRVTKI